MLFSKSYLCLLLLNTFFFPIKSTLEVICYISESELEQPDVFYQSWMKHPQQEFWDNLPLDSCTRFIFELKQFNNYSINQFKVKMQNKHRDKNELGITNVDTTVAYPQYRKAINLVWKRYFYGFSIMWDEHALATAKSEWKKRDFSRQVMSQMTWQRWAFSQGVLCDPRTHHLIRTNKLYAWHKTIIHVILDMEFHKENKAIMDKFLENPEGCVSPLVEIGIPKYRIVIGLHVIGEKLRDVCKDEAKAREIMDMNRKLVCFAKWSGLGGVMACDLESDDHTGRVCGMGRYPFLKSYTRQQHACQSVVVQAAVSGESGAMVLQPVVVRSGVNVVLLILLSHVIYE